MLGIRVVLAAGVALALAACGQPRLDGSSDEAFKRSIDAVKRPLSKEDRRRFEDALVIVGTKDVDGVVAVLDPDSVQRRRRDSLDGKTAGEVLREAEGVAARGRPGSESLEDIRLQANEVSAISTLRNIASAQGLWQAAAKIDVDGDERGEAGFFREMSGTLGTRRSPDGGELGAVVEPPVLSGAFRLHGEASAVTRSGYVFRIFLPGDNGDAVEEVPRGAFTAPVDTDLAETTWCCYAAPKKHGVSGRRSFFVNQTGDILAADSASYSGDAAFSAQNAGAAFAAGGSDKCIVGRTAVGARGRDGHVWKQVN